MVKYQELWNEENTNIRERYDLAMERILEIPSEERVAEPYRSYFNQMAAFTAQIEELARLQLREDLDAFTLEELQQLNDRLYADILPEHYTESYANPAYAVRMLGADLGPLLSAFYAQFRAAIVFAYECRLTDITILCETLIEIYNMFEDGEPQARAVRVLQRLHRCDPDLPHPGTAGSGLKLCEGYHHGVGFKRPSLSVPVW